MSNFFKYFPVLEYDIEGKRRKVFQTVPNILFRVQLIRSVMQNISAYYDHLIHEGDTPEILADKIYGDPEAHWVILLANDIVDPYYDWPLTFSQFDEYIIKKYGSVEAATQTIHHYEMVIRREESKSGVVSEFRYQVNEANLASSMADSTIPYDYYDNLAETQEVAVTNNIQIGTGTVVEVKYRESVSNYDYELQENDKKRSIKIIKPEYYGQILTEFQRLSGAQSRFNVSRRLRY